MTLLAAAPSSTTDRLTLTAPQKTEIATTLGLSGNALSIWTNHNVLYLDNNQSNQAQYDALDKALSLIPAAMHNTATITVNGYLGNSSTYQSETLGFRRPYEGVNIFDLRVGTQSENPFPSLVAGKSVDVYSVAVYHELNHVVDAFYVQKNPTLEARRLDLLSRAGNDSNNYLRSMFAGDFFTNSPQEFIASISNQWFTDSAMTMDLGFARFQQGRPEPLNQALFFAEIYSQGTNETLFYSSNTQGNLTRTSIPLTRNAAGHIKTLVWGNQLYGFGLDGEGYVTGYQVFEAQQKFWDNNGSADGFGTASGTWATTTVGNSSQGWGADFEGTVVPADTDTTTASPVAFGMATSGLSAGTINVSGTVQSGNMTFGAASGHVRLAGGTINLSANATIKVDNVISTIDSAITGAGTSLTKSGTGTLVLSGGGSGGGALILQAGTVRVGAHDGISTGRMLPIRSGLTGLLDLNGFNQTLSGMTSEVGDASRTFAIAGGAGSTLTINATAAAEFGPGGAGVTLSDNAARAFTLDMSGLGGFVWNGANQAFRVGLRSGTQNTGGSTGNFTVLLADSSTITASTIALGDVTANSHGGTSLLRLGNSTTLNANTISVGASGRSNATMNFRSGVSNPTVTVRGMDGAAPVTSWDVGRVANFQASTWTADVNLSGSTLDAKVSTLRIATIDAGSTANRTGVQNASFTMSRGVLEVGNLVVGNYVTSGTGTATGTYSANGTFTLNHADGLVRAGSVVLANNTGTSTGGTKTVTGRFNLNAGTLEAATINRGAGGGNANVVMPEFNFSGGTVRNAPGQNLTISNVPIILTGAGTRIFEATANQTITVASDAIISGPGLGFTKAGDGTMIIDSNSTYTGLTTVSAGTLLVNGTQAGAFSVASGATLGGTGTIQGNLTLGGDSLLWITDLDSPLTMGGNSTLSFTGDGGGFGIDRLANIDWETILEGTYTLVSGNVDFANIRNVGLSNAHLLDSGYSAYFQEGSLQLVVTPVPEPSTIVLLGAGASILGLRATRRRRATSIRRNGRQRLLFGMRSSTARHSSHCGQRNHSRNRLEQPY
jgi:autotransporter-associated beta strand protein